MLALLVAAAFVGSAPDGERACPRHPRTLVDAVGDVRVQADERVLRTARARALVRSTDLRRATVSLSRGASCATAEFLGRPIAGRLSVGVWLVDGGGRPLAVDAVYADFGANGVRSGRVTTSSRTLDPTNVRLSLSGSKVSFRFRLRRPLLPGGELRLERLVWHIAMSSSLDRKPFAAMDTAPSDRNRKPRGVRQSDGRLVRLP